MCLYAQEPKEPQNACALRQHLGGSMGELSTIGWVSKEAQKATSRKKNHQAQKHRRKVQTQMDNQQLSMHSTLPKSKK